MNDDDYPTYRIEYVFPDKRAWPDFLHPRRPPTYTILRARTSFQAKRQFEENVPDAKVTAIWRRVWNAD